MAVDATTSSTSANSSSNANLLAGQQNLSTSYDTFLQLLTTQLKNQDPTSPLDTNQFTQQLVQMTGVQQQLLSNTLLQKLVDGQSSLGSGAAGAVGLIGKTVTAESSSATTTAAGGSGSWDYSLGAAAAGATATVTNSAGVTVWSGALPDLSSGKHTFTWNGKTSSGAAAPAGDYTLSISAATANGQSISTDLTQTGVVQAITSDGTGATSIQIAGRGKAAVSSVTSVTS